MFKKQPKTVKAGHIDFNLHPRENKLLISTPDEQLTMSFYQLDLDKDNFSYLFSKDGFICCAIWNEQADKIVVMGEHPAYSLVKMALDGTNTQTLYKGSHRVGPPNRIPNSTDYVYTGGHFNFDINYYQFDTNQAQSIADSSVVDRLPAISSDGLILAYISRQTGMSQIWLHNNASKQQRQLTKFTDHRRYLDLKFSPDGQLLATLMDGAIKLINANSGVERQLKVSQQIIRGMSWLDSKTLAYSIKNLGKWRVHHYNINTDEVTGFDEKWAYIQYHAEDEKNIYVDHDNELFIKNKKLNIKAFNVIDFNSIFNFQLLNNSLYYRAKMPKSMDIYQLDLITLEESLALKSVRLGVFQVSKQGVYFTYMKNQTADIFRTH